MTTVTVANRDLPVEVALKTINGTQTEKFDNMDGFDAWFDATQHRIAGQMADASITMISIEKIEAATRKAKPPTKAVEKKAAEVKAARAKAEKENAATDRKEAARARRVHAGLDAKEAARANGKAEATKASETKAGAKGKPGETVKPKAGTKTPAPAKAAPVKATGTKEVKAPKAKKAGAVARHGVKVTSSAFKGEKDYGSLAKAFVDLKLPWPSTAFQKFRTELKAKLKGTFENEKKVAYSFVAYEK